VPGLLDKRLVFVTGKGGVGKSTVATALGVLAAREGRRTIVAELASHERVQRVFAADEETPLEQRRFTEIELLPGLYTISIDPQYAMEEYLRVKTGPLGQALGASRLFQAFAMATPGMRELLSIGKVWELAQFERRTEDAVPYDLVVVDAPATGHGVGILRTPRTFAEVARVGPIAHQAGKIQASIEDRDFTGVIAVCTPEEMPVNETLVLDEQLRGDGLELDAVVLNARYPDRFESEDVPVLSSALAAAGDPHTRGALKSALSERARASVQSRQEARLREAFGDRLVRLPYLFSAELGPSELAVLADALAVEA
jgi:anion-transporting  ArsA/GET3 family ATPase